MYTAKETAAVTRLTLRRIQYWDATGLVKASIEHGGRGPGFRRVWSFPDLVVLRAVKKLLDANVSLQKVRQVLEYLRGRYTDKELASISLMTFGSDVIALPVGSELPFSVLESQGQTVMKISFEEVAQEVRERVADLGLVVA